MSRKQGTHHPHTTTQHPAHSHEHDTVRVNTNPDQGFFNAGEAQIHGTSTHPLHPHPPAGTRPAHPAHHQPHLPPHQVRPHQLRAHHLRAHHLRPTAHQQRRKRSRKQS